MTELPGPSDSMGAAPRLPASGLSDIRRLLRRIRDAMAGAQTVSVQARLDRIVSLIAANMVSEVCSLYLRRAGDVLELYATEGLNKAAVHKTRLRIGEGVIGDVAARARPIALSNAQAHPGFAYRPETGEEIYHSMMGVPVLRNSRVVGVLAVQNRTQRHYTDEEVETLQTVAMVVAEMVGSGELISRDELREADGIALLPLRLTGLKLHGGPATGEAVLHRDRPRIVNVVAEDPALELERLNAALASMYDALDVMLSDDRLESGSESREILETYRLIAEDRGWLRRIQEAIGEGLTADAAVAKVQEATSARMATVQDAYLRERMVDFDDLGNRLLQHLSVSSDASGVSDRPAAERIVVFARNLGPAELLDYDLDRLCGIVLEEGSPTAHVAIMARALDIPIVGRVAGCLGRVEAGDPIIVDGDNAQVFVRPTENVRTLFGKYRARPGRTAGALCGAARSRTGQPRRCARIVEPERRPAGRNERFRGSRGGRRRAVPHRDPVHGPPGFSGRRRAVGNLHAGSGRRRRRAGGFPHARYRRRQGAALSARSQGRQPRYGLARDPDRPGPAGHPAPPVARHDPGVGRTGAEPHVSDGRRPGRIRIRPPAGRYGTGAGGKGGQPAAGKRVRRRHARGAGAWSGSYRRWSNGPISFRSAATICSSSRSPATGAIRACRAVTIRSPRPFWRWSGRSSKTAAPAAAARVCR